jgi:hypothetical protein
LPDGDTETFLVGSLAAILLFHINKSQTSSGDKEDLLGPSTLMKAFSSFSNSLGLKVGKATRAELMTSREQFLSGRNKRSLPSNPR